ncbi:MAG: hypothetical protein CL927_13880 [Deltaproteobacteria bacterium]|nr:hypothetical protein [Deltaproteobacteria bacterium]
MHVVRPLLLAVMLTACAGKSSDPPADAAPGADGEAGSEGGGDAAGEASGGGTGDEGGAGSGAGTGGTGTGSETGGDTGDTGAPPPGGPWAVISGIYGSQYAEGVAVTAAGAVAFAGSFENGIDLGDGGFASRGRDDLLVGQLSGVDGALEWNVTTGDGGSDVAYDLAIAPDGAIYAVGWFDEELVFPDVTFTSKGEYDGFMVRWEADGTFAWALQLGGRGDDRMRAVDADTAGACVAGFTSNGITGTGLPLSPSSLLDGVVICIDTAGTPTWGETLGFGSGTAPALAVAVDADGVRAGGYFTGEVDLGAGRVASLGDRDGWLKQWDRNGTTGTGRTFGAVGDQEVRALAATLDGTAVVGQWAGGAFLDTEATPDGGMDAFLMTVDRALESSTAVLFGGDGEDAALDVAARADGALAVTGYSSGSLSLASEHAALGEEDLFVGVWDGSWSASARFGGPAEDIGRTVSWHPSGDVVLGGTSFGSIEIAGAVLAGYGDRDFLVARVAL